MDLMQKKGMIFSEEILTEQLKLIDLLLSCHYFGTSQNTVNPT